MGIKKWALAFALLFAVPATMAFAQDSTQKVTPNSEAIEITVNVNTAPAEELSALLKGVGIKKAEAIVEYRKQHGDFSSKNDLIKVKGIGTSIVKQNESRILL